ncbi:hypothetical protein K505DRAFT_373597 [Melanomma pulvis-pyrius CBS 109.77]|uniref:DUF6594 domain-containing protein n=1 Tax=Melanomma pulvis-pyrius CBS 109.77 TaxID=1314802 RepID=A0A6A6XHZ6_9PLEO|nr:hypothetical protein K505DRAFT_373597 [Melanomma pulvis-pyrius CBS 109.77]
MEVPNQITELNGIAGYMTADGDLWVTRRYERLHLINILAIQQRMSDLERDIDDAVKYERSLGRGETCSLPETSPETLLARLQETVKAYDDAILSLASIKRAESPVPHIVRSLKVFGENENRSSLVTALRPSPTHRNATSHLLSIATGPRSWFYSKGVRLAVIVVLIVLVSLMNALFANTVRATNFGAIAAYSAIVVVFISQSN